MKWLRSRMMKEATPHRSYSPTRRLQKSQWNLNKTTGTLHHHVAPILVAVWLAFALVVNVIEFVDTVDNVIVAVIAIGNAIMVDDISDADML